MQQQKDEKELKRIHISHIIKTTLIDKEALNQYYIGGEFKTKSSNIIGVLFQSKEPFTVSSFLEIEIKVPGLAHIIKALGRIIQIKEIKEDKLYDIGLSFEKISQKSSQVVSDLTKLSYNTDKVNGERKKVLMNFLMKTGFNNSNRERGWFNIPSIGIGKFKKRH